MENYICRAKSTDSRSWVYGYLVKYDYGDETDYFIIPENLNCDFYELANYAVRVIPETIGRFTGINDLEGTRVFEGDFVQLLGEVKFTFGVSDGEVKYGRGGFYVGDFELIKSINVIATYDWIFRGKVVGNKIDNPELMEVYGK